MAKTKKRKKLKFLRVYDPDLEKCIDYKTAIKQIDKKQDKHHYLCPICKSPKATLTIVRNDERPFFKTYGKHAKDCAGGVSSQKYKQLVTNYRNFVKDPQNKASFLQQLKDKLQPSNIKNNQQNTQKNANNNSNILNNSNNNFKNSQSKITNKPHQYKICNRNINKLKSELDVNDFNYQNALPVGLYGKVSFDLKSKKPDPKGHFINYPIMDEEENVIITLRLSSYYETLIEKIEESENKVVKIFGLFKSHKFNNDYQIELYNEDDLRFLE